MRNTIMLVLLGLCAAGCASSGGGRLPEDFEEPAACRTADTRRCAEELARMKKHESNTTPEERQVLLQEIKPETGNQSASQILKQRGTAAPSAPVSGAKADEPAVPAPIAVPDLPGELTPDEQRQIIEQIQEAGPAAGQDTRPAQQLPPLTFPKPAPAAPSIDTGDSPFSDP